MQNVVKGCITHVFEVLAVVARIGEISQVMLDDMRPQWETAKVTELA